MDCPGVAARWGSSNVAIMQLPSAFIVALAGFAEYLTLARTSFPSYISAEYAVNTLLQEITDVLKDHVVKDMDEKKQVFIMRLLIVVFIAISVVIAIVQYKSNVTFIAQLMGVSWGALAGAFLAPFLYGLYWKKTTRAACYVSFVSGVGVMTLNLFFRSSFPTVLQSPINAGAFAMVAGLVLVPIVSLFTKKPDKKWVEATFACYDRKIEVPVRQSLDE